ncbi:MAG TPA: hypothetical protein VJR94_10285, partial [Candidatus Nitrosocosmicus sp.]|nr:hypothetical protein [Candidatus Nitrosocosmicus sp.]
MHYINYFTILVLLLPLFFVSTMFSPATFGEETPASIITPSNSICCKNETGFSSQTPSSTSVTNPLKQISTQEENPQKQIDETNADPSTTSELDSTPDSATSTVASPLKKIETNKNSIITPSNSICCKNETGFSSQTPSSTSVTNPLKQISTQEENPQKQI